MGWIYLKKMLKGCQGCFASDPPYNSKTVTFPPCSGRGRDREASTWSILFFPPVLQGCTLPLPSGVATWTSRSKHSFNKSTPASPPPAPLAPSRTVSPGHLSTLTHPGELLPDFIRTPSPTYAARGCRIGWGKATLALLSPLCSCIGIPDTEHWESWGLEVCYFKHPKWGNPSLKVQSLELFWKIWDICMFRFSLFSIVIPRGFGWFVLALFIYFFLLLSWSLGNWLRCTEVVERECWALDEPEVLQKII